VAEQLTQALGVVVLYGALCWCCFRNKKREAPSAIAAGEILLGYASQSGDAERIAKQHAELLSRQGPVTALALNRITPDMLSNTTLALFVVSTYGEGEPPDTALRFCKQWLSSGPGQLDEQPLQRLHFAVLALGDSSYRYYCGFGKQLFAGLQAHGAQPLFEPVLVDRLAPGHFQQWRDSLAQTGAFETESLSFVDADSEAEYQCVLEQRRLLNGGSPGGPIFQLRFGLCSDGISDNLAPQWQAGDIAVVTIPGATPQRREYSIANLPQDGGLELVVRQICKDDGSPGLGSAYLTNALPVTATVTLTIRGNKGFHAPASDKPMILIGNGTGIAGLRAHLRHRALHGGAPAWLIFGERTRQYDKVFDDEISGWQQTGVLGEVDRVFSRDGDHHRYVQHALQAESNRLVEWLDDGAVIYVCGSLQGMAAAVHRTLLDALGEAALESLTLDGRYRRDVY